MEDRHEQLFGRQERGAFPSAVEEKRRPRSSTAVRSRARGRFWGWVAAVVAILVIAGFVASRQAGAWLRPRIEAKLNRELTGYTVRLPELHLRIRDLGLTLIGLRITQNAHPEKPVAQLDSFDIGVHWTALLHARLVADVRIVHPTLHVDTKQLQAEAGDEVDLEDKGWQRAIEAIYPLKINRLELIDGDVTYIDGDQKKPLRIDELWLLAENIRNVRLADKVYPSELHLAATVFDSGRLKAVGWANFLAEPYATIYADIDLDRVPVDSLEPVTQQANVRIHNGVLSARGHVESTEKIVIAQLKQLTIDGVSVQYVHRKETAAAEARRLEEVQETAKDLSNEPSTLIEVDDLVIRNARIGFVDESRDPQYELFLSDTDIDVRGFTNQATPRPAEASIAGAFMGAGRTRVKASFRPVEKTPEFDLRVEIEATPLRTMNDLLRSYGDFDVAAGQFAFYSELSAKNGALRGYVKPLFTEMDVYDRRQDADKPLFHELYEMLVGGVAKVLQNRDDDVATKADVTGRVDDPNVSTWQVVIRLVGNAFFRAIVPGFEGSLKKP